MTAVSTLSRLEASSLALRMRLDTLTRQVADGRKGPYYGDIAPQARVAIDLRADMARRDVWQDTIDSTLSRSSVAQNAMQRISDIATDFYRKAITIDGTSGTLISSIATQARAAMAEIASLLNETHAGQYIFGGTDSANPPVPDAKGIAHSGMATDIAKGLNHQVRTAIDDLGNLNEIRPCLNESAQFDDAGNPLEIAFEGGVHLGQ